MRVNIYAEEMTDRVEVVSKTIDGVTYTGVRFYLYMPVTVPAHREIVDGCMGIEEGIVPIQQKRGPFIHREGDDDSSAVTFWGKRDLKDVLRKALELLERHHNEGVSNAKKQ